MPAYFHLLLTVFAVVAVLLWPSCRRDVGLRKIVALEEEPRAA
jgi:hypothetical protein